MIDKPSAALASGIPSPATQDGADDWIDLVAAIRQVLQDIELIQDGGILACGSADVERWEGSGYIYLEADLDENADQNIDINVHNGRVFIRIASDEGLAGRDCNGS